MPTISQFFGILIRMYFDDHNPPHFHAAYGEHKASFEIESGNVVDGKMPKTAIKLIEEWRTLHVQELLKNWEKAQNETLPDKIKPLE